MLIVGVRGCLHLVRGSRAASTAVAARRECEEAKALGACVDLERYPLLEPETEKYQALVSQHRKQLQANGVTTLPGFLTPKAVADAVMEVEEKEGRAYTMQTDHNIYLRLFSIVLPQATKIEITQRRRIITSTSGYFNYYYIQFENPDLLVCLHEKIH